MHKNASATADSAPDSDGELTALPANTMAGFERERKREGRGMGERENVREEGRRTPPPREIISGYRVAPMRKRRDIPVRSRRFRRRLVDGR